MAKAHDLGLPETLGFGRLDIRSVRTRDGGVYARYLADDDVVYRVNIGSTCRLKEFYQGRLIAQTDHPGLEACFLQHMMATQPYHHPRFRDLYHWITGAVNILVLYEVEDRMAYYPSGSCFALHQPIVDQNREVRDQLRHYIEREGSLSPVRHLDSQTGYILRCTEEGDVDIEGVEIETYGASLFDLLDALALLWDNGLVPEQREYRLEVAEVPVSLKGNVFIHAAPPGSRYRTYSVIRDEQGRPTDLEQCAEVFSEHSMRYIERVEAEAS